MILLSADWAIASYIFLILLLVIGKWIFYNLSEEKEVFQRAEFLQQCPFCIHLFFDYQPSRLKVCPRCQSYLSVEEEQRGPQK